MILRYTYTFHTSHLKLTNKILNPYKWVGIFCTTFIILTFVAHLGTTQGAQMIEAIKQFGNIAFDNPVVHLPSVWQV